MNKEHSIDNQAFKRVNSNIVEIQFIRSEILKYTMNYFLQKGFSIIDPPIIHEYIPNKKSELYFSINGSMFSLNSSNALYLGAYATMLGNVFAISPTFRNESDAGDHLTEFRILEVEMVNCAFDKCIEVVHDYLKSLLLYLCIQKKTAYAERFKKLYDEFRIDFESYSDIIERLKSKGCTIDYGADLSDYDNEVSNIIKNPVFVVDYPFPIATWTALPKENKIAYAFNLILPNQYGELAEGCQRNNDYKVFEHKFKKAGIQSLDWYISAIKNCDSDRSGFGIGIERLVRWIIGSKNISDTALFPRFE